MVKVDRLQQIVLDHLLNHIVGRADKIVGNRTGFDLRIHDFVRLILLVNNVDTGFFLKDIDDIIIHIFAPIVHNQLLGAAG